ncbi:MAG TPA: energy transducer TonB [Smithella sp.]|jgi:protein TonB|nr:energy transducer TonB [Smithella sp.]
MNYQTRAFQISFLLHSLIVVLIVIGSTYIAQHKKEIVLDFDLQKPVPDVERVETPVPAPSVEKKFASPAVRQNVQEKEPSPSRPPEESPRPSSIPETPPVVKLPETRNQETSPVGQGTTDTAKAVKEGTPGTVTMAREGTGMNPGVGNANGGKEAVVTKYLNENFAYIRDRILKNVSYPDTARRKGWEGKVVLSFVIMANGSVKAFKIIQSSGFTVLDKSAIETVRDTAPFPRPPGEAQLVIPITYQLE